MYDIIIVGAGPAGLTSALYAGRANKKVLVLEAKAYGGQIINTLEIENYPGIPNISGFEYATNLYNQVKNLGIEINMEPVIRIEDDLRVITTKKEYKAKSIILATGAENRKLNLPKEEDFIGKGISYCATCDGAFYKKKIVAVNGGGNTALEDALYLSNLVEKVYLIHRRDTFRGEDKYVEEIKRKENIEIIYNSIITKLIGENHLEKIEVTTSGTTREIDVNGLFIAIGQTPKNEIFKNIIELNDAGYIISEDGVHTTHSKIYVAGDTRVKDLRQLTTAVSDGAIAATVAMKEMED